MFISNKNCFAILPSYTSRKDALQSAGETAKSGVEALAREYKDMLNALGNNLEKSSGVVNAFYQSVSQTKVADKQDLRNRIEVHNES